MPSDSETETCGRTDLLPISKLPLPTHLTSPRQFLPLRREVATAAMGTTRSVRLFMSALLLVQGFLQLLYQLTLSVTHIAVFFLCREGK
jgi:hypothetical protein